MESIPFSTFTLFLEVKILTGTLTALRKKLCFGSTKISRIEWSGYG